MGLEVRGQTSRLPKSVATDEKSIGLLDYTAEIIKLKSLAELIRALALLQKVGEADE